MLVLLDSTVLIDRARGGLAGRRVARDDAARGVTLSQADCLVAAAVSTRGATVATGNPRHFPMRGIRVEHWPVGS